MNLGRRALFHRDYDLKPHHYSKFVLKENIIADLGITMPTYVSDGLTERL